MISNALKSLQLVLGGAVSPSVHQGPLEIAKVFFKQHTADTHFIRLKAALIRFLHICENCLTINQDLIQKDQTEYHDQLMSDFARLKYELPSIIST